MKTKLIFALLFCSVNLFGQTFFGVTLGKRFIVQPDKKWSGGNAKEGLPYYGFAPRPPMANFTEYAVAITPKTGLAFSVTALGKIPKTQSESLKGRLLKSLTEKYGKPKGRTERKSEINFIQEHFIFTKDDLEIELRCHVGEPSEPDLFGLSYTSKKLEAQAESELPNSNAKI